MTAKRDFKLLVRQRMKKTGERYSTARAHLLSKVLTGPAGPRWPGLIAGYSGFGGLQADTAVLRSVLAHAGARPDRGEPLDEAWIHGLCGGVGFLYAVFEYQGHPPFLTIVSRSRSMPDAFAAEGLARAGVRTSVHETGAPKTARRHLDDALAAGRPAIAVVDMPCLSYYGMPPEMAGMSPHLVAVVGEDGDDVWLDDRSVVPIRVSHDELARARGSYRKAKHRLVTVDAVDEGYDLAAAALDAVRLTVRCYQEAPVRSFAANFGFAGLEKWQRLLTDPKDKKGWAKVFATPEALYVGLRRVYDCIEHEYTAPDAGRPLYADFLDRAARVTGRSGLGGAATLYREAGALWSELAGAIASSGDDAVRRGCELSDRRSELLDAKGGACADEMRALWRKRRALGAECTLAGAPAADLLARLSETLGRIIDVERRAVAALADAAA